MSTLLLILEYWVMQECVYVMYRVMAADYFSGHMSLYPDTVP